MKTNLIYLLIIPLLFACQKDDTKPVDPNYTNFKILSIKITEMPFLDANSAGWDPLDGPDVYFNMEDVNSNVLFNGSSSRFKDVLVSELPFSWSFVDAYQITNLTVTHFVTVYDFDTLDPNDEIGYVGFTLSEHKDGYPKSISKSRNGVNITITGEWY